MQCVILGLGSNSFFCGMSPLELLRSACDDLRAILSDFVVSSVYRTKALYYENQSDFYNVVAKGNVCDSENPHCFLEKIHLIEQKYGRNREKEIRFGPRSLDIDIEEFGNFVLNDADLILPHPRMKERQFVLIPLLEILDKNADCNKWEQINSILKTLPNQDVLKCNEVFYAKSN